MNSRLFLTLDSAPRAALVQQMASAAVKFIFALPLDVQRVVRDRLYPAKGKLRVLPPVKDAFLDQFQGAAQAECDASGICDSEVVARVLLVKAARFMSKEERQSDNHLARALGLSNATLGRWLRAYDAGGAWALVPRKSSGRPKQQNG